MSASRSPAFYEQILKEPFRAMVDECIHQLERQGIGIDVNEDALAAQPDNYYVLSNLRDVTQIQAGGRL